MNGLQRWTRFVSLSVSVSGLAFALASLVAPRTALAFNVPPPDGAVTDTSGTLTREDDAFLETRLARYRSHSANEIGVLVVPSLGGEPIENVAYQAFNTWGVGKKHRDNGVLLVNARGDRRSRIETGAGIAVLPDYAVDGNSNLVQLLRDIEMPALDTYLVYAEEMRNVARVQAFRDFLVAKAQRWSY